MSTELREQIERAIVLLEAVERFFATNEDAGVGDLPVMYDGDQCDGYCLSDDCATTALCLQEELKAVAR